MKNKLIAWLVKKEVSYLCMIFALLAYPAAIRGEYVTWIIIMVIGFFLEKLLEAVQVKK